MATSTTNALTLSTSSAFFDAKATPRQPPSASPQCVSLPTNLSPPSLHSQSRLSKTNAYCGKKARNVVAKATTGEAQATTPPEPLTTTTTTETTTEFDSSDILKTIQETWDKVEDKYAVSSLAVAGFIGLWGSAGLISAIDRLPLVPGVLELVGIGYSGWFAYKNLISKTDRDALIQNITNTYKDIIGSS